MKEENKVIYRTKSKIDKDTITIFGCGNFGEGKIHLRKAEASLLYIELHKFLMNEK